MVEGEVLEVELRENVVEQLYSGKIGGIYIHITTDIYRDIMVIFLG